MARGILEVPAGGMPKDDRQWATFLRGLNDLIQVSNLPPGLTVTLSPGSVPLASLAGISGASLLGRGTGGAGPVLELNAASVALLVQSSIDHGSIGGLSDDDHPQYLQKTTLTTNGDLFVRIAGAVSRLGVGADGTVLGVTSGAPAWVTPAVPASVTSGIYTPTATLVANLTTVTPYPFQYMKVGSVTTVSGRIDATATAPTGTTQVRLSLPVATTFASTSNCSGTGYSSSANHGAAVFADVVNNDAVVSWVANSTSSENMFLTFTYRN